MSYSFYENPKKNSVSELYKENQKLLNFLSKKPSLEHLKLWVERNNIPWVEIQEFMHLTTLAFIDFYTTKKWKEDHKFNKDQLEKGIKVEKEHTTLDFIAEKIAKDHLEEIPDYYTHLLKMEELIID